MNTKFKYRVTLNKNNKDFDNSTEFEFDVEVLQYGQEKSHGDSFYGYKLTLLKKPEYLWPQIQEDHVARMVCNQLQFGYDSRPKEMISDADWHFAPQVRVFRRVESEESIWEYLVVSAYTG